MEVLTGLAINSITIVAGGIATGAALSFGTFFLARTAIHAGAAAGSAAADTFVNVIRRIAHKDKYYVVYRGHTHEITSDQYTALTLGSDWVVIPKKEMDKHKAIDINDAANA